MGRGLPIGLPDFQPKDIAQDLLAVTGPGCGELVRLALQEKRRIGEGVIIHSQGFHDFGVRITQGPLAERVPLFLVAFPLGEDEELHRGSLAPRVGAHHPIAVALIIKIERHLGFLDLGVGVDHGFIGFARPSKQRPGDRVQQRGFTRAVLT